MTKKLTVKSMVLCAMFIALSAIGAFIKPFGNSIAFDSFPAFLAASMFGPFFGAIVGALGHLISAAVSGFPLSAPIHLLIAVEMAVVMLAYGFVARRLGLILAAVVGTILNGVVTTAVFIPIMGMPFFLTMVGPLTMVSAINIVLAVAVQIALQKSGATKSLDCTNTKLWNL